MHKAILETKNLTYAYHDGKTALNGITLSVLHGESVGIIGPNGSGKSTLLMHFNGILEGEGEVVVDSMPVRKENLKAIRRIVGWLSQQSDDQLFMPTLFDDVAFGPLNMGLSDADVRVRVEEALHLVGLEHLASRPPHHLSGGEKKAAAIAAILSMRPQVILMDEPTNNLDHASRRSLIEFLRELPITKVIVSHDLEMIIDLCPRVVLLDRGVVVADGPSAQILGDEELLRAHRLEAPLSVVLKKEREERPESKGRPEKRRREAWGLRLGQHPTPQPNAQTQEDV
jgi:cobalt/nickel transport system ATP-binding protein